jgi:hypothetical protein
MPEHRAVLDSDRERQKLIADPRDRDVGNRVQRMDMEHLAWLKNDWTGLNGGPWAIQTVPPVHVRIKLK